MYSSSATTSEQTAVNLCNWSSVCFYIFELLYASYTLFRITYKNERSKALISAVVMIMWSAA